MIWLQRERTKKAIPVSFRGKRRIEKALTLLVAAGAKREFNSRVWKAAKKQLKRESGGKCAYCESSTETVAHADVEHFRPKSRYWWLAYCYDNYLYSCQICNESYKGDAFPVRTTPMAEPVIPPALTAEEISALVARFAPDPLEEAEGLAWHEFHAAMQAESAQLLNPYYDDPELFFKWEADPVLKEVRLRPKNATPEAKGAVEAAQTYYGLNREELLRWRWRTYEVLETFKESLEAEALSEALRQKIRRQIATMISAQAEYAGMARYFVQHEWNLTLLTD